MVKKEATKGKNDKGTAAKDTFDPVLIEPSHAATAVLMLDSPEEEVVIKAAEAIYKFVEKCNPNKMLLLELEAVPRLLKLVTSDSRPIRRNSCLVLGSMSKHPNVAKLLKQLDIIPMLIKLLGPDEDAVVNEYAAICLVSLTNYYSCIRIVCEQNGLEPLIHCLTSSDPDVQKSSIEALSQLLQDFEARATIRDLNGLQPIIELLKSEYAVIQSLALTALHLASEDAENRVTLRDTNLIADLINIITNPLFSDIHVQAIHVLTNMFLDFATIEMLKDNGLMKRLILITMDAPPPVEEEKKPKSTKEKEKPTSASKSGKKGKASDAKNEKQKNDQAVSLVIIPSSPEVKEQVSNAIRRAAKNAESRRLLNEQEIEKLLIYLLSHTSISVQAAASLAVETMSENLVSRDVFGKLGGIVSLVKLLKDGNRVVQEAVVKTLSALTTANEYNCHEVMKHGGVEPLISLVTDNNATVMEHATTVLTNMAAEGPLHENIVHCGVIPALVAALSFEDPIIQNKIVQAIGIFVTEACHRKQFVASDGVVPLIGLLSSSNKDVRSSVTSAIAILAADEPTANVICQRGALDMLRYMQTSDELGNSFVEVAISKLLDCSLSAKYALSGKLCTSDIICDGFFDAGRLKHGKPLLPLSYYIREPMNHKRPVLLVYAGLSVCDQTQLHAACDETITAVVQPLPKPESVDLLVDSRLAQSIEEAKEMMMPLQFASMAERAISLAQFVSRKMGGPIERGSLSSFSWELPMSQLKYEFKSNVIPLGAITAGIHYHRALLFKVIGDRIGIPSSLVRGAFNCAWNELVLSDDYEDASIKFPPKTYVIDLIHEPGRLMRTDSAAAVTYCQS
jgi:HEAT repeat protein